MRFEETVARGYGEAEQNPTTLHEGDTRLACSSSRPMAFLQEAAYHISAVY